MARGELTIDRGFARTFLNWRDAGTGADALSDTELLLACARALQLDLVCLQSSTAPGGEESFSVLAGNIGRLTAAELFVLWIVDGVFQTATAEIGTMELMTAIGRSPEDVGEMLRQCSDRVTATMARGADAGVHGIIVADDIAYGRGTLVAPGFVERFLLPVWKNQVGVAHGADLPVLFHSDGRLTAILDCVAAAGFDGLQCIEPGAGMDLRVVQERWGDRLCLMGSIDPALLSDPAAPSDSAATSDPLHRAVAETMDCAAERGGIIFGTCSGLYDGLSPARVERMYRLARKLDPAGSFR